MPRSAGVFVDTAYLVALLNRLDRHHALARRLAKQWQRDGTRLFTNDAVLVELGNFFSRSPVRPRVVPAIRRLRASSGWAIRGVEPELVARAEARYESHDDKCWSLTDCLSMECMDDDGLGVVATTDDHFAQAGFRILMGR